MRKESFSYWSLFFLIALPGVSMATPSTTFWAPSTPYIQPFGVLHVTYDTYFRSNLALPVDTGLTIGVIPNEKFQAEIGFDLFYPTPRLDGFIETPTQWNGKFGSPENALFAGSPGWSFGIFGVGSEKDVTDQNVLHFMLGKTFDLGLFQVGVYRGGNKNLFMSSEGKENLSGVMAGWFSPDIKVPNLYKIVLAADVMTGNNPLGAWGGGVYFYFTPTIDLLMGPVFFNDPDLYGGNRSVWTMQLDIDLNVM